MGYLLNLLCADYNSGFLEDGTGRCEGMNSFCLRMVGNFIEQMDMGKPNIVHRLIGTIQSAVEKAYARTNRSGEAPSFAETEEAEALEAAVQDPAAEDL